jgi:hypothetical protein
LAKLLIIYFVKEKGRVIESSVGSPVCCSNGFVGIRFHRILFMVDDLGARERKDANNCAIIYQ